MEMEKQILDMIKESDKALSVYEIYDNFKFKSSDDLKNLLKTLNKMEDTLQIYKTKKDNYMLFSNSHLKLGKFIGNKKGFGFVDIEGDIDVFIAPNNTNNAIHGDSVIVEITAEKGSDLEGKIVKIVDRQLDIMVGEYLLDQRGNGVIDLDNEKVKLTIKVEQSKSMNAMEGHKVLVKVLKKIGDTVYEGQVIKVLGHKTDPGVDILSIAAKYKIEDEFPEEVLKEIETLPREVSEKDLIGRKDLRNEMIFTIDGNDTKDIDDAVSVEVLSNGKYKLGVHIADVSYYVRENTSLDDDAYLRGTSVYLADRVIPMLPRQLSNGICSLNPNVDRLAISCEMEIDENGNIGEYSIFESVINSRKQMTYDAVNEVIEKNNTPVGYEEFKETLLQMKEVADRLRKNKVRRGYIDFEIDEAKLIVDEKGEVTDVKLRNRGAGEKLIEDLMIAANETVATHISNLQLPFIYRVHGVPSELKIQNFLKFVGVLGYQITGSVKDLTPKAMQNILAQLKDAKEYHIFSSLLLRSMQKAIYDKTNIGHFGLGSKCYTHFTSPIRRYPDTTVHRLLRTYVFNKDTSGETTKFWDNKLVMLGAHTSERERAAADCEREVDDMKIAEYMEKHIGEEFNGIISSVVSFGMFIELENLIEGLVKLDTLKDDSYFYNEINFSLTGRSTKKTYRLGDPVRVKVTGASKELKTVDFEIVNVINQEN